MAQAHTGRPLARRSAVCVKPLVSKAAVVVALLLGLVELGGVYFGGWGQGRMAHQSISSSCNLCISFGSMYFWADAGDTFDLTYDVEVNEGTFLLWISRLTPGHLGDVEGRTAVQSSGPGTWHAPISRPGWYHLVLSGASERGGYDVGYHIRWRIEHAKPWPETFAGMLFGSNP